MSKFTPEEKVKIARDPARPGTADFIEALFTDFFEQRGDRLCREDGGHPVRLTSREGAELMAAAIYTR